jgi:hypothetical protein
MKGISSTFLGYAFVTSVTEHNSCLLALHMFSNHLCVLTATIAILSNLTYQMYVSTKTHYGSDWQTA